MIVREAIRMLHSEASEQLSGLTVKQLGVWSCAKSMATPTCCIEYALLASGANAD